MNRPCRPLQLSLCEDMATCDEPLVEIISDNSVRYSSIQSKCRSAIQNKSCSNESTLLLSNKPDRCKERSCFAKLKHKFQQRSQCLKSKPAILILIWSFLMSTLHCIVTDPSTVIIPVTLVFFQGVEKVNVNFIAVIGIVYSVSFAVLQVFYPLAGYLADVRYGRKRCVITSLWSFFVTTILLGLCGILVALGLFFLFFRDRQPYALIPVIVALVLGLPFAIIFFTSIVAFNANIIQFGLDQLHDLSTEHLVLFIHWYVLISFVGTEVVKAQSNFLLSLCKMYFWSIVITIYSNLAVICFFLLISLCVAFHKHRTWFLSDSGSRNPYRLVYKVISFAREHRNPIQRSAFTYCEDELPSRLDLGKEKYGGPFSTEQVEDVKVFLGVFKVLLALGPLFAVERSTISFLLPLFFRHIFEIYIYQCSYFDEAYPSIVFVLLLIFYIVLLRPLIQNRMPSMLTRVGLGMMLMLTPILFFFILDTTTHAITMSNSCFLLSTNNTTEALVRNNSAWPILLVNIPLGANIFGSMIFYIAIYEFLYSQSPHSMKGLMIGTFFAIRGTFQLLGILILFPFLGWRSSFPSFPSCGFIYNITCMTIAFFGMAGYIWIAKKYQNRQRDEPDNIYRYAEEYYEKAQKEPDYSYDYDNLNVCTID